MIPEEKSRLREELLLKLRNFSTEERAQQNQKIIEKLFTLPEFQNAERIGFFASEEFEVNTDELIKKSLETGKKVFLPKVRNNTELEFHEIKNLDELELGEYSIRAPKAEAPKIEISKIDLLVVPALAFTKTGDRLGRGGGFFDRVLQKFAGVSVGLAFDFQMLPELPIEEWDKKVSRVLSAAEIE